MPETHTHIQMLSDWLASDAVPDGKKWREGARLLSAIERSVASLESRLALYEELETAAKLLDDALMSMRGGEVSPAVRNMHKVLREAVAALEARKDPRRVEV